MICAPSSESLKDSWTFNTDMRCNCYIHLERIKDLFSYNMHTVITHVEQKLAELANRTEEELEEELEKQEKSVELAARVCANLHE